jgi:hypothetical protein
VEAPNLLAIKLAALFEVQSLTMFPSNDRMAAGHQFDLPYSVEQWDDGDSYVEELIALTG